MSQNSKGQILVVQDNASLPLLRQLLTDVGYQVLEAKSGEEALALLAQNSVDLAIVEIDLPGMDGYTLCRQLRQQDKTREMPVMMLAFRGHINDKVAGFEAGVDDFLTKPYESQELVYRLKILLARKGKRLDMPAPEPTHGRVIALFGTKGGVGRTTIGVNLAVSLQRRSKCKVVLFDADFFFGDIALHLGLSPSHSILDLINRIDEVDEEVLDQVLVQHPSGLRVLLSPRDPEDVEFITPSHVARILDKLATIYDYIIVDCQAIYDERTLQILERADAIMLLIKPEVGCVKNMAVFSELAAKLKLSFDKKIYIVLNRAGSKSGIGSKEIERIFRRQISFQVGSGGNAVVLSVNRGVPLVVEQPNHPFSLQVTQMADYFLKTMPPLDGQFAAR